MMKKVLSILLSALLLLGSLPILSLSVAADEPTDISAAVISLSKTGYVYNGTAKEPKVKSVTVTLGDIAKKLSAGTDYTVAYDNNVDAGTATVTVTGTGAYAGEAVKEFRIYRRSITDGVKCKSLAKLYPNKEPQYSVTYKGMELVKDTDYSIEIRNNDRTGIDSAKVVIKGLGNFKGSKWITRSVAPVQVKKLKITGADTSSYKLSWKSQKNDKITGYRIYTCDKDGSNTKLVKELASNSTKLSGLASGKAQYYTVRSFKRKGDEYIFGEYSKPVQGCTKPDKVALNLVTKSKDGKKLVVKWTPVSCTKYVIEYTTSKKFKKGIKSVTVKNGNASSKKIKIGKNSKKYFARIRAIKTYQGGKKEKKGKWSAKVSSSFSVLYSSYTTHYPYDPNRINNLRVASRYIDGTVLAPGETF